MSKSVSISKTCVAVDAIYSHTFAGHDALASAFVAKCEDSPVILVLSAFTETDRTCKMNFNKSNQGPGSRRVGNGLTNIGRATKVFGTKLRGHGGFVGCFCS